MCCILALFAGAGIISIWLFFCYGKVMFLMTIRASHVHFQWAYNDPKKIVDLVSRHNVTASDDLFAGTFALCQLVERRGLRGQLVF